MAGQNLPLSGLAPAQTPLSGNDLILLTQLTAAGLKTTSSTIDDLVSYLNINVTLNDAAIGALGYIKEVTKGSSLAGEGTTASPLSINLSPDTGNLLFNRLNGLYYGIEAPADISNLYVDSLLGDDSNAGTRVSPLQTFGFALSKITGTNNQTIWLKCGDDRPEYLMDYAVAVSGGVTLTVKGYGDPYLDGAINDDNVAYAAAHTNDPNYRDYLGTVAAPIQRPRIRGVYTSVSAGDIVYAYNFNLQRGVVLRFEAVEIFLNAIDTIGNTNSINYADSLIYGDSSSLVRLFSTIVTDDRTADIYAGSKRQQGLVNATAIGAPGILLSQSNVRRIANGRQPGQYTSIIRDVSSMVVTPYFLISPGYGVGVMQDNFYSFMDTNGENALLGTIVKDNTGDVVYPRSSYTGFSRPYTAYMNPAGYNTNTTGYTYLPNGFILQWGQVNPSTPQDTIYFPISFPNACFSVQCSPFGINGGQQIINPVAVNTANFQWKSVRIASGGYADSGLPGTYMAIGR